MDLNRSLSVCGPTSAGSKDIESRDDDEGDDEGGRDKSQTPVQEKRRRKRGKTSEYHGEDD